MAGGPMFWMAKHQDVVALSTTESEYISLAKGTQQAQWVHSFLMEVNHGVALPSKMGSDNQGAIAISENPKFHSRVKHIDIRYHYLHDAIEGGKVDVDYVPLEDNPADILTKSLGATIHCHQLKLLGMI